MVINISLLGDWIAVGHLSSYRYHTLLSGVGSGEARGHALPPPNNFCERVCPIMCGLKKFL